MDDRGGVSRILEIPHNYCALGAADAIYQQVMRLAQFRRADQSIGDFIEELELARRETESEMKMGTRFIERFASISRMHYAGLPRQEKLPAIASRHKSLKFVDVAACTRRLLGSHGGGSRRDVLNTEEAAGL